VTVFNARQRLVDQTWGLTWTWLSRWIKNTGAFLLEGVVRRMIQRSEIWNQFFDLVHVDEIALVGPSLVRALREKFGLVSCYVIDDPFGNRDGPKWRLFLNAVSEYDLITVVREPNVQEAYDHGAQNVLRVFMSVDEIAHAPKDLSKREKEKWSSEVAFIGTWFPERGPFMKTLIERGVPLTLRGNNWKKAEEWPVIEPYWEGPAVTSEDYTKAIQCAKICIGLLSEGNRDLHTTRSMEIPYVGSVLCAERTREHLQLYEEGREAVFWDDAEECADKCFELLADDGRREKIAKRGHERCVENGYLNEHVMCKILKKIK
jgi:spore maturation protein CgeB